ncbi:hypothetical protein NCC78_16835, partial [Micromonospora phytophila]|nr:hypothetical protein [Micromonospora phytophila]
MSAGRFREVDHDLLADYLGGALDGTPQERVVARLVNEEPAWVEAYTLLAPAVAGVRADLAAWGEPGPEMPAAVTDRIVAALAHAASADSRASATGAAGHPLADEATSADAGADALAFDNLPPAATDPSGRDPVDADPGSGGTGRSGPVPAQPLGGTG